MIKEKEGDLIKMAENGHFDVIVHGCNTKKTMGAGLAKKLIEKYPIIGEYDVYGANPGSICAVQVSEKLIIVNAYTQIYWGSKNLTYENRYLYIRECMKQIKKEFGDKRIGLPCIGAGLAGGNWAKIKDIIIEELNGCDYTIVYFKK